MSQSFALPKVRKAMLWDGKQYWHTWKKCLEHTFSQLDKPAKIVKIDGLPENVVPITRG